MTPRLSILVPCYNQEVLAIRALDSIPRRDDIEVIASDDGSTDKTLFNLVKYKEEHPELNLIIRANGRNCGCFPNGNILLEAARGEYMHTLDNDDFLYTEAYNGVVDMLDGEYDVYHISLHTNDNRVLFADPNSQIRPVSNIAKFVRRAFAEGLRYRLDRPADADWFYNAELLARNPKCKYTGVVAYHYNYPREGSLMDLHAKGLLK